MKLRHTLSRRKNVSRPDLDRSSASSTPNFNLSAEEALGEPSSVEDDVREKAKAIVAAMRPSVGQRCSWRRA